MKKIIKIKRKVLQKPDEPYCGVITYCILKGVDFSEIQRLHEKARIPPSRGMYYLCFHKLDNKVRSFVEERGMMLSAKDKCFETMWGSKKAVLARDFVKNAKVLFEKCKHRITTFKRMTRQTYANIILKALLKNRMVGVMLMEDINKYKGKRESFFIPHWVTVHGFKKNEDGVSFLVFNSYKGASAWMSEKELFNKMDLTRKYHFSPQLFYIE